MRNLLFLVLFLSTISSFAQLSYEERLEFELKDGYENEEILPFGKEGFLFRSKSEKKSGGEYDWKFEFYDRNMKPVKEKIISLDKKMRVMLTVNTEEKSHTLFRGKREEFSLVTVESSSLEIIEVNGDFPKKSIIDEMVILGKQAFINSSIKNKPVLISVNWRTGKKSLIPINIKDYRLKRTQIMDIQSLEKANEVLVYVRVVNDKRSSDIFVIRLNENGEKIGMIPLTKEVERNIVSVSGSKIDDKKYIFTGTYGKKSMVMAEGLFFCQVREESVDYIKFYNFLDLKDFLSYLPERKQERIEKRKKRKEKKNKDYSLSYSIAEHDIMETEDGGYLFLGEAYYPTFRTETYTTTTTVNGVTQTVTQTRTVFDGYQYTHAVLAKFSKSGELEWDNCFEMWPLYKPFVVKKFISISEKDSRSIKMVYASGQKIITKRVGIGGDVLQDDTSEEIETGYSGDKSKRAFTMIDHWYENYFIAYGSQVIKNRKDEDVKGKRKVYFVSKIGL